MFRVVPFCKFIIAVLWLVILMLLYGLRVADTTVMFIAAIGLWWQYRLWKMTLYFDKGVMIKKRGNFFNRRQVLMLKNISVMQTITFSDIFPGVIILNYPGERFIIFGFNGIQIKNIESYIKRNMA